MSDSIMNPFALGSGEDPNPYGTPDEEDRGALCDCTQSLGIEYNYVPDWRPPHAIREYHQNWKDGIKQTFQLRNRDFAILDKGFDSNDVYTIEARHPDTDILLGFILWNDGTIQYSNFGAQLSRKALNFGMSTKREDYDLAGVHGEGFKVASLVMIRKGYRVRYEASQFYWNFQFGGRDGDLLYCKLTRMDGKKLDKLMGEYETRAKSGSTRELKANIWEDITVKIGRVLGRGERVDRADFLRWMKISLDLDRPSTIIRTCYGSLILDDQFKGRIYLKGLLLEGESTNPFKFCYNFYRGEVNRDRERLSSPTDEAKTLARIWGEAVRLNEAAALPKLVEMLQGDTPWADANRVEEYISIETARRIWQRLQDENAQGSLFYYYDQHGDQDIELITKSLQKKPAPLKKATWLCLRRFSLIRTPEEQRYSLLRNASKTSRPRNPYSDDVERVLLSVLALDARTRDLRLDFRSGDDAELDILLHGPDLVINDKWLDFYASHEGSSCSLFLEAAAQQAAIKRFSCTHIIKSLYDSVLVELSNGTNAEKKRSSHTGDYLRQLASEKIDQMPCMVEVSQGEAVGVLEVSWVHAESEKISRLHSLDLKGRITMHRMSTCADKRLKLLTSNPSERELPSPAGAVSIVNFHKVADCGCTERTILLKDRRSVFHGLNHSEEYFPMVSRVDTHAFFALPPEPTRPKAPGVLARPGDGAPAQGPTFPTRSKNDMKDNYHSQGTGFEQSFDSSDEGESGLQFSGKSPTHGNGSDHTILSRALRSGCESPTSSLPKSQSLQGGSDSDCWTESRYKRRSEQFLDQVGTQLTLLALKEGELNEVRTELSMRSEALAVATEALRIYRLRLEQYIAAVEGLQNLLENFNDEFDRMGVQCRVMNASDDSHAKLLFEQVVQLKEQNRCLSTHLKQAEKEVREVLDTVADGALRVKASLGAAKRKRIKVEQPDPKGDDAARLFDGAVKRARKEIIEEPLCPSGLKI